MHVGVRAPVDVAHQLNVGKELENAIAIKIIGAYKTSMVQMQRIVVGVNAVHKVVLVGSLCKREGALASRIAVNIVVSNPHNPVVCVDIATFKDRAVIGVVYYGLFCRWT